MLSVRDGPMNGFAVTIAYAFIGWVLCGVTMSVGIKFTTLKASLVLHALAAPIFFMGLSLFIFIALIHGLHFTSPSCFLASWS